MNRIPIAFAQTVAVLLIALAGSPAGGQTWEPGGTRITFQPGTQSAPLVLPSGAMVFSDSESIRVWVSMTRYQQPSFWNPRPWYQTQRVSRGGGSADLPRAIDYLEHSVLVVWSDDRSPAHGSDIFVQRIGPAGTWPSFIWDGIPVCVADSMQEDPAVADDGAGGFYVAWTDARNGGSDTDIYLQHFREYGGVWDNWEANGLLVCGAAGDQTAPVLVADGAGGVVIVWRDRRSGDSDLYAKRIGAYGATEPGWGADGSAICAASGEQGRAVLLPDSSGAYLAWVDHRLGVGLPFVTRIQGNGQVAAGWTENGTAVSSNPSQNALSLALCRSGDGGVMVAWNWFSARTGHGTSVQRVGPGGSVAWDRAGVQVASDAVFGTAPAVMSDGAGGVFLAWSADGGGSVDLRAVRLDPSGAFHQFWPFGGVVVSDAAGDQVLPDWRSGGPPNGPILPDGFGGFVVIWTDTRVSDDIDLYAQRVTKNGVAAPQGGTTFCFEYCPPPNYIHRIYPNPARGSTTMLAWVPEDRVVLIDIIDVRGRVLRTQRVPNLPGGTVMGIPVPMTGLRSGVYFLRYRLEGAWSPSGSFGARRVVLIR